MKKITLLFFPLFMAIFAFNNNNNLLPVNKVNEVIQEDGPFVLYKNDKILVKYIFEENGQ